jgi:hypothetical protein
MKGIINSAFFIFCIILIYGFNPGDNCSMYAPIKEGMKLEMKSYSDKDKLTGTTKSNVISVKKAATGQTVEIKAETYDKKDNLSGNSTYNMVCEKGIFYVDMKTMLSQEQMTMFGDMQVNVEADKLDIPPDPKEGQELKNGSIIMTATTEASPISMKLSMTVTNRKVAAIEEMTVPAGKYKCVKITYDSEVKNLFTVKLKVAEWYSKEVGLVRSETYNTKDKLQSYSVLTSAR